MFVDAVNWHFGLVDLRVERLDINTHVLMRVRYVGFSIVRCRYDDEN